MRKIDEFYTEEAALWFANNRDHGRRVRFYDKPENEERSPTGGHFVEKEGGRFVVYLAEGNAEREET